MQSGGGVVIALYWSLHHDLNMTSHVLRQAFFCELDRLCGGADAIGVRRELCLLRTHFPARIVTRTYGKSNRFINHN